MDHGLDAVVVGAGLAGLACALRLAEAGAGVLVLESGDGPGGRVRTDDAGGFRVDRGFQLVNPAYPALRRVLGEGGLAELALQPFGAGAAVASGRHHHLLGDPRRLPAAALPSLLAPLGSPREKAAFLAWALRAATADPRSVRDGADEPLASALDRAGVRGKLRTGVVDPFLAGVLGDDEGRTSASFARLVVRSFVLGTPGVPPDGVQRLPDLLAGRLAALPGTELRLGTAVEEVRAGAGGVRVRTADGELTARTVVVATDPWAAQDLLPGLEVPAPRGLTTFWHEAPEQPARGSRARLLHLDGDRRGPVVNSAVMTAVAPGYGPTGRHLVASTVLGAGPGDGPGLEPVVLRQLEHLWGQGTADWELVATSAVPHALPALLPPLRARQDPALGDGVFLAGDHRDTASQQGALTSGRRAAGAVLNALGLRPPAPAAA
ncbi:NAD(P)/FAD-dependent oxidoreductase [Quadrisphaera setariae]|uniref:NAD(P)/FAD-dependent oxidoreductase n=1 Tax=Quadrisphaera setariae TaxID=2593304 RepID=UPI00164F7C15|nr:NAD(P)/FAD-dependent oxidoreductase [Quadrisphaera setariae]